jgi:hypothetical protein
MLNQCLMQLNNTSGVLLPPGIYVIRRMRMRGTWLPSSMENIYISVCVGSCQQERSSACGTAMTTWGGYTVSRRTVLATTWTQVRRPLKCIYICFSYCCSKWLTLWKKYPSVEKLVVIRVPLTTFGAIMTASVDRGRFQIQTTLHNIFGLFNMSFWILDGRKTCLGQYNDFIRCSVHRAIE